MEKRRDLQKTCACALGSLDWTSERATSRAGWRFSVIFPSKHCAGASEREVTITKAAQAAVKLMCPERQLHGPVGVVLFIFLQITTPTRARTKRPSPNPHQAERKRCGRVMEKQRDLKKTCARAIGSLQGSSERVLREQLHGRVGGFQRFVLQILAPARSKMKRPSPSLRQAE